MLDKNCELVGLSEKQIWYEGSKRVEKKHLFGKKDNCA